MKPTDDSALPSLFSTYTSPPSLDSVTSFFVSSYHNEIHSIVTLGYIALHNSFPSLEKNVVPSFPQYAICFPLTSAIFSTHSVWLPSPFTVRPSQHDYKISIILQELPSTSGTDICAVCKTFDEPLKQVHFEECIGKQIIQLRSNPLVSFLCR